MHEALQPEMTNEERLTQWIAKYGDDVMQTCFMYLLDRSLAQDAMQDTFIKAWQGMSKFERRNNSSEKTWIIRIAINTCIDYKRTSWFRHIDLSKALEDIPSPFISVSENSRKLFYEVLWLPTKYKQVILLYFYHNLTMDETASILKVSRAAVQKRLQKAYVLLRYLPEGGVDFEN